MTSPQALRLALPLVLILTLVWGTNWALFPYAVREVSVWTFRAVSVTGAGLLLLAFARWRGLSLTVPQSQRGTLMLAACIYLVVWNIASTYAAVLIPSGQAAILGFTMPMWAALAAWALFGERPTRRVGAAIGLAGVGVALLIGRGAAVYADAPLGFALGLLAGIGWALGTLVLKRRPIDASPLVLTGWQLLVAAVPIGLGALWFGEGPWFMPSPGSIALIAYITIVPMAVGNLAWFSIVGLLPASLAGLSSVLVPIVAMVTGALIHGEPLGPVQWAAMVCCAGGLALALLKPSAKA
jgi:drug/metabolite transporter (DMT)-like permease